MERSIPILICLFALLSCRTRVETPPPSTTTLGPTAELDWMLGDWQQSHDEQGRESREYWERLSDTYYKGTGYTLQGRDTVFKQDLRMWNDGGLWHYGLKGANNFSAEFYFGTQSKERFVAVRDWNEFPQEIEYELRGDTLVSVVSGKGRHEVFLFVKRR